MKKAINIFASATVAATVPAAAVGAIYAMGAPVDASGTGMSKAFTSTMTVAGIILDTRKDKWTTMMSARDCGFYWVKVAMPDGRSWVTHALRANVKGECAFKLNVPSSVKGKSADWVVSWKGAGPTTDLVHVKGVVEPAVAAITIKQK